MCFFGILRFMVTFAMHSIHKGGLIRLLVAGFFCACTLHCFGSEPPCGALMRPLPLWWNATGKAEPYQCYVEQGLFFTSEIVIGDGSSSFIRKTVYITGKGQIYFVEKLVGGKRTHTNPFLNYMAKSAKSKQMQPA